MSDSLGSTVREANTALLVEGRLDAVGEYFARGYVAHGTSSDLKGGVNAVRTFLEALLRAFPEPRVEVEILVEAKDRVAWRRRIRSTHRGSYKGFPATGRRIVWCDMVTSRFRNGLVAEDWVITDLAEQLLRGREQRSRSRRDGHRFAAV